MHYNFCIVYAHANILSSCLLECASAFMQFRFKIVMFEIRPHLLKLLCSIISAQYVPNCLFFIMSSALCHCISRRTITINLYSSIKVYSATNTPSIFLRSVIGMLDNNVWCIGTNLSFKLDSPDEKYCCQCTARYTNKCYSVWHEIEDSISTSLLNIRTICHGIRQYFHVQSAVFFSNHRKLLLTSSQL